MMINFNLTKDQFGAMSLIDAQGIVHPHIRIIRAFPISNPSHGFAIVDQNGHELVWLNDLSQLPDSLKELIQTELSFFEFIPEIEKIVHLNTFALPSIWDVHTNRGKTRLKLKSEQDIRRVSEEDLLITDTNGIQYLIRNKKNLDKFSKKVLDRFM